MRKSRKTIVLLMSKADYRREKFMSLLLGASSLGMGIVAAHFWGDMAFLNTCAYSCVFSFILFSLSIGNIFWGGYIYEKETTK